MNATIDYRAIYDSLLDAQNQFSNADAPPYPRLRGMVAQKFSQRVSEDREFRLKVTSDFAHRSITGTKDLTTAECVTWLKMLEREGFVEWLKAREHETHHQAIHD